MNRYSMKWAENKQLDLSDLDLSDCPVIYGKFECTQCHKELNPAAAMLGDVCQQCTKKNHKRSN